MFAFQVEVTIETGSRFETSDSSLNLLDSIQQVGAQKHGSKFLTKVENFEENKISRKSTERSNSLFEKFVGSLELSPEKRTKTLPTNFSPKKILSENV